MPESKADNRMRFLYSKTDEAMLPAGQPHLVYVCYADWTDGRLNLMMHTHEDIAEILILLTGHGHFAIGSRRYQISAGDVMLINAGVLHDELPHTSEYYHTLCIGVKGLELPGLAPGQLTGDGNSPFFHQPKQFDDLAHLFHLMERQAAEKESYYQTICQNLMLSALGLIQQMTAFQGASVAPEAETTCARVRRYIDEHFAEGFSIDQLSRQFYISPYHLSHIFKQQTGYSPKQYILRRRIGAAQIRLVHSQDTIQQIAADVGFEDGNYFSRLFTKYIGISPTEYRALRLERP